MNKKGILVADVCDGREKYLCYEDGIITFTQILVIPNLTCSLRCKYCAAGNQYADRKVFEPKQVVEDFDKLMSACKTKQVNIQGGEVFVNPRIAEFFELFSKMDNLKKCESLALFTNATVIPTDEQLKAYKKINIPKKMMISNYDLPNVKVDKFIEKLDEYEIDYVVFDKERYWFYPGSPLEKTGFTDDELKEVIRRCTKFCRASKIIDGRFFVCGQNGYALYDKLKDYVDVRNCPTDDLARKLYEHVYKTESYDICKYCIGVYEGMDLVPAAEQL
jgi:organic radical activating enzyme